MIEVPTVAASVEPDPTEIATVPAVRVDEALTVPATLDSIGVTVIVYDPA